MALDIKYTQLYQYGGPVAELIIDGEKRLFEPNGVQELIRVQQLKNNDTTTLERAMEDLLKFQYAYYQLPEITDDSVSDQINMVI